MIAIGSDHGGFALKQALMAHLDRRGLAYKDFGTYSEVSRIREGSGKRRRLRRV